MSNSDLIPALPDDLPTLAVRINEEHAACVRAASAALAHALDAGRMLIKAKSLLRHGEWADWLQANVPTIKPSTERLYRQLAEELPALLDGEDTVEDIAELSIRKAREMIIARSRPQPRALPSPEAQPQNANPVSTIHEETPSASVPTSYPPPMVYKPMEEEEPAEGEKEEPQIDCQRNMTLEPVQKHAATRRGTVEGLKTALEDAYVHYVAQHRVDGTDLMIEALGSLFWMWNGGAGLPPAPCNGLGAKVPIKGKEEV